MRLAVSTSYWPIVWPAPHSAEVTLQLQNCALHLPVREVTHEIQASEPGLAQAYPVLDAEQLRTPSAKSERILTKDGRIVLETFDDYGKTRDPYHDLIVGSDVRMHYGIRPDDPTTACFETAWNFTFERADWQVAISTECRMTCDVQNFYLNRKLRATEGADEIEVLTKEWSETVPRGLL